MTKSDHDFPLNQFLTFRLARVQAKLNAQGTKLLRQVAGLTLVQWRIIVLLGSGDGTTSANISRLADIDKGLLSRRLRSLIESEIVSAHTSETDNRVSILSLTPKGQKLYQDTLPHMQERQRRLREVLSEAELDTLYKALEKLEYAAEHGPLT